MSTNNQELGTLVLKLWVWDLNQCTAQKWGFNKLTGLQKVRPTVASGMQAQKHHLAFPSFSISSSLVSMMMALSTRC
jgi:hypothetical protein